ncbi:uncharacterized protein LOC108198229 [Daucus carota subsp. sativus]|uniref:uncharacterized protein LOC108198229 n=1 Tax=Daucus carota subsp. sativus TaxID=79200 RepID=UPI003083ECA7
MSYPLILVVIAVKTKGSDLDNRFVVPYNRDLLLLFQCHINVEICNNSRSLKYLFKYCLKGHDNATMLLKKNNGSRVNIQQVQAGKPLDEVKHYLDGRYICASEAAWRIFGFDIHSRWPSVDRLPIHMPATSMLVLELVSRCSKYVTEQIRRGASWRAGLLQIKRSLLLGITHIIGIIASSKIGMFCEFVQIGTLPSTRIYFNLDVEPVNELRNRLKEEGYNSSRGFALAVNDTVPVLEHVSFASLIGNADSILDKVSVLVTFIVKKIEEADSWWFHSCTVCHEEVVKVERKFKCEACNCSFPYSEKRFRILVLAEDATHACNVILMDRIVKRIFGTTATNMLNEMKKV